MLEMKDGVQVAVTYYRPIARTPGETFPVIMEMVPYRKDDFFALGDYEYGAWFAKRGYVVARVDVRGTGGSTGPIPPANILKPKFRMPKNWSTSCQRKAGPMARSGCTAFPGAHSTP
ncbi:CocE/NonD family hydrolase [Neopusillimonas aromaticivorans]|uniref:CocE/NonD family hydrolase n=1 Tax=Neopusillimonas aromaticivorans TaxID=2979868 RepID=UPI0025964E71|nr:CocE/NonD family hydrolase [Neopusillimonas aromaticivorans]WJJ94454.1 CocE/NonD family hydrolase [Neopusillimonas aromaticivorans]